MILGAIEISSRSTRLSVIEVNDGGSVRIAERSHALTAGIENLERLTALVMAEVEAARELGADRIEVVSEPPLRGTRLIRLIERASEGIGTGPVRIPADRESVSASYLAATVPLETHDESGVGVAMIGSSTLGLGVGLTGSIPEWIGTRPAGAAVISDLARFSDPPRPNQIEAAMTGASRKVESLSPPRMSRLLATSDFAPVIERLCGSTITHGDARRGLDAILGQTSDDLAAWFGIEPATSRLLPGAIVGHAAFADVFGIPVEPVSCDPVAGRHWLAEAGRLSGRSLS